MLTTLSKPFRFFRKRKYLTAFVIAFVTLQNVKKIKDGDL